MCGGRPACGILRAAGRSAAGEDWRLGRRAPRLPSLASCSHFSFSTPVESARVSARSLNDAQVPPGAALFISLPSRKRDSPSTTTPCLQSPCLSAGAWGERAKGFGRGVYITEFPITHSFGLFPEARELRLPPSNRRAPAAPREVAAAGESQSSRRAWVPASQGERGTSLSVLYQRRLGFPLMARRGHSPTLGFRRV